MEYFAKGTKIPILNGGEAVVCDKLGEGGQGVVYRVKLGVRDYAMKWYSPNTIVNPKKFYANLRNNIIKGAPTDAFLWPRFLTTVFNGSFGYIMELRPQGYYEFSDFLLAKVRFSSIEAVVNTALNITNGFRELHRSGYSYQDLNDGNFFIDPQNGEVLICDNDNVAPYGESLGIAGKARYMAPEVVRNISRPDCMTDRFSLAVILFRLLFLDHPLEGQRTLCPCLTEELELKFYGIEPVFIFDPYNDSNRPVRGVHSNVLRFWPVYPEFIRVLFTRAFSKQCMTGGAQRVSDSEWQKAFIELRNSMIKCPCGGDTFIDLNASETSCINCGLAIPRPPVLTVKGSRVALFPGNRIYRCHTASDSDDFTLVQGEVIRNASRPSIWGLRNLSNRIWTATDKKGTRKSIAPHEVLVVVNTREIDFGDCVGYIE